MWGLDFKTLVEDVIVAVATILMIMSLTKLIGPILEKYPLLWFVLGAILFLYASRIAKKVTGA